MLSAQISGKEQQIREIVTMKSTSHLKRNVERLENVKSLFGCALHMHQPIIPSKKDSGFISNLQYMFDNPNEGDNHNAEKFSICYKRMNIIIKELINEGCDPRIMLDYSGNLLWGLMKMGRNDIINELLELTQNQQKKNNTEWLGSFWSHAVAPSTPIRDLKLQISAWQHQFLSIFGEEALSRVKGFSLPEMSLPNHPDSLYVLVKEIRKAGYRWILVQEHTIENLDGSVLSEKQKYIPNLLVAKNCTGKKECIEVLIKTQGSDTKLVGQMQPYYQALEIDKQLVGGKTIPSMVTQIADGENGGVMMNEFPKAYIQANQRCSSSQIKSESTLAANGTEYLEFLESKGLKIVDYPMVQALNQFKIWEIVGRDVNKHTVNDAIKILMKKDQGFDMVGSSWTNNLSWEEGYQNVIEPINILSNKFHDKYDNLVNRNPKTTESSDYKEALLHLLLLETSCFRYWGQGKWTKYAEDIYIQGCNLIDNRYE